MSLFLINVVLVLVLPNAYGPSLLIRAQKSATNKGHNVVHESTHEQVDIFQYLEDQKWVYRSPLFLAPSDG